MIISRNHINSFININKIKDEKIALAFNRLGFEVENIFNIPVFNNLVLGRIGSIVKIENTKLSYCMVDIGEDLVVPIVCGAKNIKEDDFVIVAKIGAKLLNDFEIKEAKIQNKISHGMICSLSEIGVPKDIIGKNSVDGVEILNGFENINTSNLGESIYNILNLADTFFELDITVNRSDALGTISLIKELALFFKKEMAIDESKIISSYFSKENYEIEIDENVTENINYFSYLTLEIPKEINYQFKYSDYLLLSANGYTKKDSDIENLISYTKIITGTYLYLMVGDVEFEKGTLKLTEENKLELSFANNENVISVGSLNSNKILSSITEKTKKLVLFAINVKPNLMRKIDKIINIDSFIKSSFIKPISNFRTKLSLSLFSAFVKEEQEIIDNNEPIQEIVDNSVLKNNIIFSLSNVNKYLGIRLTNKFILQTLNNLDFEILNNEKNNYVVFPPSYRLDIVNKQDVYEELARIYGYDNIKEKPVILPAIKKTYNVEKNITKYTSDFLINNGFSQVKTYSLTSDVTANEYNLFNYSDRVKVLLPLSKDREVMRTSLVNNLLTIGKYNINRQNNNLKLFTIDKIYQKNHDFKHLSLLVEGNFYQDKFTKEKVEWNFYNFKAVVLKLLEKNNINQADLSFIKIEDTKISVLHPYQSANIFYKNELIGVIGKIHPKVGSSFNLNNVFICEISLDFLLNIDINTSFVKLDKFQSSKKALTVVMQNNYSVKDLEHHFNSYSETLEKNIKIKYVFQDKYVLDKNEYSLNYDVEIYKSDQQITDAESNEILQNLITILLKNNFTIK